MKQAFLALTFLFLMAAESGAQTINDVPLKDIDVEYIEIVGTAKLFSTKLNIELDFGQENKFWTDKEYQVKNAEGKKITFNSMIDALNFMGKNGYELIMPYVVTVSNQNIYHYLLRRKKSPEQALMKEK
jgi:hypothetical protein